MNADGSKKGYTYLGRPVEGFDIPDFKAVLKWRGGDLQTMRNTIMGPIAHLAEDFERISFHIGTQGQLSAAYHPSDKGHQLPVVMIIHGLTGDEESPNVMSAASHFISQGYPVVRLNLRGAGASADISRGSAHGGLTEDLALVIDDLAQRQYGAGIVLYGISMGGNMMIKYLGEQGGRAAKNIRAAIGVSTPLSLKAVQERLMQTRNSMYHNYLLLGLKNYARRLGTSGDPILAAQAQLANSIWEYDDKFVAPSHGMKGAEDYYAQQSCGAFLDRVAVPTLMIHAENDPWVPVENYHERHWPEDEMITVLLTEDGGHVGFHAKDSRVPWQERVAGNYLVALKLSHSAPDHAG